MDGPLLLDDDDQPPRASSGTPSSSSDMLRQFRSQQAERQRSSSYPLGEADEEESMSARSFEACMVRMSIVDECTSDVPESAFLQAAAHLRCAVKGRKPQYLFTESGIKLRWYFQRTPVRMARVLNAVVYVSICFFELPSWVHDEQWSLPAWSSLDSPADYYTFGLPVLPPVYTMTVSLLALGGFALEMYVKYKFMGREFFMQDYWNIAKVTVICAAGLENVIGMLPFWWDRVYFGSLLRPFFIVALSKRLRVLFSCILKATPLMLEVFLLMLMVILLFAWVGMLIFEDWACNHVSAVYGDMPCFVQNFLKLHVLLTTANYPDVMMQDYTRSRWSILFYMLFLMIAMFGLLNLALALCYNKYNKHMQTWTDLCEHDMTQAVDCAYGLLATDIPAPEESGLQEATDKVAAARGEGAELGCDAAHKLAEQGGGGGQLERGVQLEEWIQLMRTMGHGSKPVRHMWCAAFAVLDVDHSGHLTRHQFSKVLEILSWKVKQGTSVAALQACGYPTRAKVFAVVSSTYWEAGMQGLRLVNAVMVGWGTERLLAWEGSRGEHEISNPLSAVIWVCFATTVLLNLQVVASVTIWGISWSSMVETPGRIPDAVVGALCFVLTPIVLSTYKHSTSTHRLLLILYLSRSLPLLGFSDKFWVLYNKFTALTRTFLSIAAVLAITLYAFASLGCIVFGGVIHGAYDGQPSSPAAGTDFATLGYWPNNFNDHASAMVTCWILLVVNNWFVIMDGFAAATTQWARLYFILFWCVAVVIVLNLFTAFIIDSVTQEMHRSPSDGLPELLDMQHVEDEIRKSSLDEAPGRRWHIVKSARVDANDSLRVPRLLH
eukprot:TRINITY_DN10372_c0_g1_i2.p1 TRINITY_DN10372_c0_g1~~TRINITY_DN10372_c0_g1_i2.p1  ORF type:complete len:834 (-),score=235.20 TRINITY_DN10372_c0_g1_i2:386-2887(-)